MFYSGANSAMQGTNYSTGTRDAAGACTPIESLFCRGLATQPGALEYVYDFNPGYGGPLKKDKLWFFADGPLDAGRELRAERLPQQELRRRRRRRPTLLNATTMTYVPDHDPAARHDASAAADTSGNRRRG